MIFLLGMTVCWNGHPASLKPCPPKSKTFPKPRPSQNQDLPKTKIKVVGQECPFDFAQRRPTHTVCASHFSQRRREMGHPARVNGAPRTRKITKAKASDKSVPSTSPSASLGASAQIRAGRATRTVLATSRKGGTRVANNLLAWNDSVSGRDTGMVVRRHCSLIRVMALRNLVIQNVPYRT